MWEYKVVNLNEFKGTYSMISAERLNKMGKQGWELVTTHITFNGEFVIFKRKV